MKASKTPKTFTSTEVPANNQQYYNPNYNTASGFTKIYPTEVAEKKPIVAKFFHTGPEDLKKTTKIQNYDFLIQDFEEKELIAFFAILRFCRPSYSYQTNKYQKSDLQTMYLEEIYKLTNFPSSESRNDIAYLLSMPLRSVQVWFQNKRQRARNLDTTVREDYYDLTLKELVEIFKEVYKSYKVKKLRERAFQ